MTRARTKIAIRIKLTVRLLGSRLSRHREGPTGGSGRERIVVALAADYGNLGDVAITEAQVRFLSMYFPGKEIVEWPISRTLPNLRAYGRALGAADVITLVGGGNTGDRYDDIEFLRELTVRRFDGIRIVGFPQSVDFSRTKYGRFAWSLARKVYRSSARLVLVARDERSGARMSKLVGREVNVAPDVVLMLEPSVPSVERSGILVALRSDGESVFSVPDRAELLERLRTMSYVRTTDTHIGPRKVYIQDRAGVLNEVWLQFARAEVVVTDRLHGMIFCAITSTPCVVLDNADGKISEFYATWLSRFDSIRLVAHDPAAVSGAVGILLEKGTGMTERDRHELAKLRRVFVDTMLPVLS